MAAQLNKTGYLAAERQSLVGMDKYFQNLGSITILGVVYTLPQLKAVVQADLDAAAAVETARGALTVLVQKQHDAHALAHAVLLGVKAYIVMQYGKKAADILTAFGFATRKPNPPKPPVKVAAAAKAKATRTARGTKGPKAKLAIKGTVPATAPATPPAPPPAPTKTA